MTMADIKINLKFSGAEIETKFEYECDNLNEIISIIRKICEEMGV